MDPDAEIAYDYSPYLYLFKSGRVQRLDPPDLVPASATDSVVASRDVIVDSATGVTARLFLPNNINAKTKLPVLIYLHGGGFVIGSPFSSTYHDFVHALVARARVLAVSLDYRLAPEHPLPAAYDDALSALRWVASHAGGSGPDSWLAGHGDLRRIFLAGDSTGANIAHNVLIQIGAGGLGGGARIEGVVLIHPYFWGKHPLDGETASVGQREWLENSWEFVSAGVIGLEDPRADPSKEAEDRLKAMPCRRALVVVAENDFYAARGLAYCETVRRSGWNESVELYVTAGVQHVFHLWAPESRKAVAMRKKIAGFLHADKLLNKLMAKFHFTSKLLDFLKNAK